MLRCFPCHQVFEQIDMHTDVDQSHYIMRWHNWVLSHVPFDWSSRGLWHPDWGRPGVNLCLYRGAKRRQWISSLIFQKRSLTTTHQSGMKPKINFLITDKSLGHFTWTDQPIELGRRSLMIIPLVEHWVNLSNTIQTPSALRTNSPIGFNPEGPASEVLVHHVWISQHMT